MSLGRVLPFLEGAVMVTSEQDRNFAVVKNLRRSENLEVRQDLIRGKQRCPALSLFATYVCSEHPFLFAFPNSNASMRTSWMPLRSLADP